MRAVSAYIIIFFALFFCNQAKALTIAPTCAEPSATLRHQTFYVDPVRGAMSNDGSAHHPWKTLAEVVDSKNKLIATQTYPDNYQNSDRNLIEMNPSAPIKPGDVIELMSGDHGNVHIRGINKEFITVQAAPGQTPVLHSLQIEWASKWMFIGLKVQGARANNSLQGRGLVDFGHNLWRGPSENIIFINGSVSTANDTRGWSDMDWITKPFKIGMHSGATCVTISGNHFFNLRDALTIDGDHSLVEGNEIDNFGNDAIDLIASNVIVRNNTITNARHTPSEPLHADGIQGWTREGAINKNVVIEKNWIINTGATHNLQGITIFDGKWEGLIISNNVVVTNHWHGIAISGIKHAKIINNTVVPSDPKKHQTWITVGKGKDGTSSRDIVVRNNIAARLIYHGDGIIADHNIVAEMIASDILGKTVYISKPGDYHGHNIIDPNIYNTLVKVDNVKGKYDLRLRGNSTAVGSGNPKLAPTTDILGRTRFPPIDVGAFAYRDRTKEK